MPQETPRCLYSDRRIFVCVKPCGVVSTDSPDGLPSLLRDAFPETRDCLRTVHRLDRVVGGVMVLARSREAARRLSAQFAAHETEKRYLAVVQGVPPRESGSFTDFLHRDKAERKTYIVATAEEETQKATLHYRLCATQNGCSLLEIMLETGRTHQIRAQCAAHGLPIVGDLKYGGAPCREHEIALWAYRLSFDHPQDGTRCTFTAPPPEYAPWDMFTDAIRERIQNCT